MSNNAIDGWFLNIGNRNNHLTCTDKQLQGRLRVCKRMRQQIGQQQGQRGLMTLACTYKNGKFHFGQPCGSWSIPCVHGCGYIYLSSLTPGTRKKCCANGCMSINSTNFDSKLQTNLELREFPLFMRQAVSSSPEFCHHSSTYNNLVAIGATKVRNYSERPGFKNREPGPSSVHMQGKLHHFFNLANSTDNSGGIGYFVLIMNQHLRLLLLCVIWTLISWI
jgi:hypothetical protein